MYKKDLRPLRTRPLTICLFQSIQITKSFLGKWDVKYNISMFISS